MLRPAMAMVRHPSSMDNLSSYFHIVVKGQILIRFAFLTTLFVEQTGYIAELHHNHVDECLNKALIQPEQNQQLVDPPTRHSIQVGAASSISPPLTAFHMDYSKDRKKRAIRFHYIRLLLAKIAEDHMAENQYKGLVELDTILREWVDRGQKG
jgi:hypothetical protein